MFIFREARVFTWKYEYICTRRIMRVDQITDSKAFIGHFGQKTIK